MTDARAAFEAFLAKPGPQFDDEVEMCWEFWQAAIKHEREAIAATFDNITQVRRFGVEIAAAIRARSQP